MFKDCWEKKFSIENILESVRPAEKGKRSTYKEESKMKTTKFMFICGVVNAVRRYSKEFPTINKYHEWIVILSKVDVVLWALIIEISFVNQFLNNWLKNILFYRVWFKGLFWYILLCADLFIPVYICCFFFTKNLKLLYYKFFYKHHSKSTSGSCESQFTLYSLYLITCNHNWNKSKLLTTITCY